MRQKSAIEIDSRDKFKGFENRLNLIQWSNKEKILINNHRIRSRILTSNLKYQVQNRIPLMMREVYYSQYAQMPYWDPYLALRHQSNLAGLMNQYHPREIVHESPESLAKFYQNSLLPLNEVAQRVLKSPDVSMQRYSNYIVYRELLNDSINAGLDSKNDYCYNQENSECSSIHSVDAEDCFDSNNQDDQGSNNTDENSYESESGTKLNLLNHTLPHHWNHQARDTIEENEDEDEGKNAFNQAQDSNTINSHCGDFRDKNSSDS